MNLNNINLEKLNLKQSVQNSHKILLNDKPIELNLDYYSVPFGLEKYSTNFMIKLSIDNDLVTFIQNFENKLIELLKIDNDELSSNLRIDSRFPPLLTCKIVNRYNKFEGEFKYSDGEFLNIYNIEKKSDIKLSIFVDSVWKINNIFFYKWKISHIILKK